MPQKNRRPFASVLRREREIIAERRAALDHPRGKDAPIVGLALSGGGIRSATFSLGLLQALSDYRLVPSIDYLSTVSGGSYIGSFFTAMFVDETSRGDGHVTGERPAFDPMRPLQSALGRDAVRKLREAGRYLTPGGTSDAFFGAAVVMRNWAAVHLVIGTAALLFFWVIGLADGVADSRQGAFSVTLSVIALLLAALLFGSSAAYWLTRRDWIPGDRFRRILGNGFAWILLVAALYFWSPWPIPAPVAWLPPAIWQVGWLACIPTSALILYALAEHRHGAVEQTSLGTGTTEEQAAEQARRDLNNPMRLIAAEDRVRTALSALTSTTLMLLLGAVGLLMIDAAGGLVARKIGLLLHMQASSGWWAKVKSAWPAIVAVAPPVLSYLANQRLKSNRPTGRSTWLERKAPTLLIVGGLTLLAVWLVGWSAIAHAAMGRLERSGLPSMGIGPFLLAPVAAVGLLLVASNLVGGFSFSFINLSSLSTFYAARLRRAYIGASSAGRTRGSVREDNPQDAIRLDQYYGGSRKGLAPIHLINITIAETMTGDSNLVARDRKGKPMHLSPSGIVYEGARPGLIEVGQAHVPLRFGEELPLANWIAISGAAVSAAIGSGTSLGTSILATLGNVRLGYWWRQDRSRSARGPLRITDLVQSYLLQELRGAFSGTRGARWYLTDGGHFENTGIYTLLQRQVPFIIASDNGADPTYEMADVIRLLGHARTDLGVEIAFLDRAALEAKLGVRSPLLDCIGPLPDLATRGSEEVGGPIAALASIRYSSGSSGTLLLIKPRMTFREPPEILAYQRGAEREDFPQQTTADQFFDEQQWEAYRLLGERAGQLLFRTYEDQSTRWRPAQLIP